MFEKIDSIQPAKEKKIKMFASTYNEAEKLWYGPEIPPLYNPNINLAQALLNAMSIFGPKVAQVIKKIENKKSTVCRINTVNFDQMM